MKISGMVVHGKKEARLLEYPTANVEYHTEERPQEGIWTCWFVVDGQQIQSVAIVGMWELAGGEPSLEVHAFKDVGNLYDKEVEVIFEERLRGLMLFKTVDALTTQIKQDMEQARAWFTSH